ncbi:MAG: asparagine synthase (glutamine-hydrolyzing), partial [Silvanigrellaceae bacterium]|nr:asparagine synthase (glutamine-hydrolyzing) [Silvanigrellaceae bacterium]
IYNHKEIRASLPKGKYNFISNSDTETILYGFIEYGTVIFKILNGIFAISIFDSLTQKLIIVRDQFGVKPLYYYKSDKVLLFGSELKSFMVYEDLNFEIDSESIFNYLTLLWCPREGTPFKYVKKLLPGHFITMDIEDLSSFEIQKYYEIPFNGVYKHKELNEVLFLLEEKLLKSVERQLLSDVPVAFFLSGGVDSSIIVAMAKRILPNERLTCYTIKTKTENGNDGFSEDLIYARKVAEIFDVDLIEVESDINIVEDFDMMIYHLDEPQADPAPLNVLNICRQAKRDGFKVLLGGTGGDDLFSGYRRHKAISFEKYLKYIPKLFLIGIKKIMSISNSKKPLFRRVKKLVQNFDVDKNERMFGYFEWLPYNSVFNLFNKTEKEKLKDFKPISLFLDLFSNIPLETNDLNKLLFLEMRTFLVDHNLNYTDKLSMATGVEVRVPFLDLELVEFSTEIEPSLKIKNHIPKYLLKKLLEKYLPNDIIYRSKTGFGAPVRSWILNDLDELIEQRLSEDNLRKRLLFEYQKVNALIRDNKLGKIDSSYSIWSLLAIDSWLSQFAEKRK